MINYYEIAKKCVDSDVPPCKDCPLCGFNVACHTVLTRELYKIVDEYKKYDSLLVAHGCFEVKNNE